MVAPSFSFFPNLNYITVNFIIENTFFNIECRFGNDDIKFECLHFQAALPE